LEKNEKNEIVDGRGCQEFLKNILDLEVTILTAVNYLHQCGFSSQLVRRRTASYKFSLEKLIDLYVEEVERFWVLGIKTLSPKRVCFIDSLSLGWRKLVKRTFALKGSQQKKKKRRQSGVYEPDRVGYIPGWVNRCPALLFSGDPLFGPRSRDKKGVDEKLEKFGVVRDRIVFCAGKQFVSENSLVIKTFLDRYSWLQKALIISDNGRSFKKKDVDIVEEWGAKHASFISATHEYMSPLDNDAFGIAKGTMREAKCPKMTESFRL
jgi:hypothetical protein